MQALRGKITSLPRFFTKASAGPDAARRRMIGRIHGEQSGRAGCGRAAADDRANPWGAIRQGRVQSGGDG